MNRYRITVDLELWAVSQEAALNAAAAVVQYANPETGDIRIEGCGDPEGTVKCSEVKI
jgi:hypothetical protein